MPSHLSKNVPDDFFILASGSPRRREFMEILGLPFIIVPPTNDPDNEPKSKSLANGQVDETPLPGESPRALVQRLSRAKAQAVLAALPSIPPPAFISSTNDPKAYNAIIIAADTVVVLENKILGKPNGPTEAVQMLKQLRRHYHTVYSGLTVASRRSPHVALPQANKPDNDILITRLNQSTVWMRPYTDAEIDAYVASGSPLDKAGAYGIQDQTFAPVAHLDGCFANVMGLPLGELATALKEIGISLPEIAPLCTQHTGHPCCQQIID